eukprot:scaffold18610_cov63-Phaeocystis_antarctica.AAC.1
MLADSHRHSAPRTAAGTACARSMRRSTKAASPTVALGEGGSSKASSKDKVADGLQMVVQLPSRSFEHEALLPCSSESTKTPHAPTQSESSRSSTSPSRKECSSSWRKQRAHDRSHERAWAPLVASKTRTLGRRALERLAEVTGSEEWSST